jgi:uncharacterized DUF497 family protein
MEFEWDENKNQQNVEKHGIDFSLAKGGFYRRNEVCHGG